MEELTFAGLKSMNKTEYQKLFAKPTTWRKAKAVLFLAKYKFSNGKIPLVALPFKKYTLAAECFKNEVKKDKDVPYKPKLTMLGSFGLTKDENGVLTAEITPMQGGLNNDYLESYGKLLFSKLKMNLNVAGEQQLNKGDVEEVLSKSEESTRGAAEITAKLNARLGRISKMLANLPKLENAVGKVDPTKLEKKLVVYREALDSVKKEAQKDGNITPEEQNDINRIQSALKTIEDKLANLTDGAEEITNVASDALIDNLENAESVEEKTAQEGSTLQDLSEEASNLEEKNRLRLGQVQKQLVELKNKIVNVRIKPDQAIKELNKLHGEASEGLGLETTEEDTSDEILAIRNKLVTDIQELKRYVDEKLTPMIEQRVEMKKQLQLEIKETGKNASVLIDDLKVNVLDKMKNKLANYETELNKLYEM